MFEESWRGRPIRNEFTPGYLLKEDGGSSLRTCQRGGLLNFWNDCPCYGKEKKFSVALRERTKRRGLLCSWCWLISNGRGLRLNKGIGSKVSGFVFRGSWSLKEAAGREPV